MKTLRIKNEAKDMEKLFGTNPKCIDWEDYLWIRISLASWHTYSRNETSNTSIRPVCFII